MTDLHYRVPIQLGRSNEFREVVCHILQPEEITHYLGEKVVDLTQTVGSQHFEVTKAYANYHHPATGSRLPAGSFAQAYSPSRRSDVTRETARLRSELAQGSQVALIWSRFGPDKELQLDALAQVTRRWRRPGEVPSRAPNSYLVTIDQVLSRYPHRHNGRIALYSAATQVPIEKADRVIADLIVGNRANQWFTSMGFHPVQAAGAESTLQIGAFVMPRQRYLLETSHAKKPPTYLLRRIADRRSWLQDFSVTND